ncbi:MAG TPA: peptide deformylase [Lacunisphaera sp.]|nr:peptide deformylase [Lacunisphaera sp.]
MTLPIVRFNSPILRKKGVKVTEFDAALGRLAADMIDTMHAAAGIGLAAQQIGQAIQLCVVDLRQTESEFEWEYDGTRPPLEIFMPLVIVNPVVITVPEPTTSYEEGCLSFPEIRGDVLRPDKLTVSFQDVKGLSHTLVCNGLLSRCVQHEADHLNGILFIDRMDKDVLAAIDPELKALKKQTREAAKKPGQ